MTTRERAEAVKSAAAEIDAAIVAKGGTTAGGLRNAAAAIAALPSGGGEKAAISVTTERGATVICDGETVHLDPTETVATFFVEEGTHELMSFKSGLRAEVRTVETPDVSLYSVNMPLEIPSEYQRVEYVEFVGEQWFDTDYKIGPNTSIEIDFRATSTLNRWIFGNSDVGRNIDANVAAGGTSFELRFGVTQFPELNIYSLFDSLLSVRRRYTFTSSCEIFIDGAKCANKYSYYNVITKSSTRNTGLGCREVPPSTNTTCMLGEVFGFRINRDGNDMLNLVPCYRKSDSVVGFYDRIRMRFFVNQGDGSFVAGPDVNV